MSMMLRFAIGSAVMTETHAKEQGLGHQ